ncbi:2-dehydro-3-deoxygluconate kinase OS=Castellaniella defragrans (strain DSM / CCUG 39792 / 65Phen)OX=1437824 GN=BN940_05161 PE=3 SV=1 [Castellaniella denitrificans]
MAMNEPLDVVTLGEAMVMLVAGRPGPLEQVEIFHKRTAGAETNVAIGLARLGLRVGWGSRLGQDSLGRYLLDSLRGEGVDCSRVILAPGERTGLLFKSRVTDGSDPLVEYHRAGSAASRMRPDDVDRDWLLSARHLHATGVFAAVSADSFEVTRRTMRLMREAGRTVSFDTNLRPTLWPSTQTMREGVNELAALADWVLPGIEEGRLLTGEREPAAIARFYLDRGARLVVVKLGPDGAYYDDGARSGHVPASPVERVVDTVGAGDGFAVGVISGLLEGLSLERAVARGAWIGARAVQVPGDTEGLPTRTVLRLAGL